MIVSSEADPRPLGTFFRLALLSVAVAAGVVVLGYLPTQALASRGAVAMMGLGVGLALVATLAGLVPVVLTVRLGPRQRTQGMLAGMALRFILVLALLLLSLLSKLDDKVVLALWTAVGYIVLLAADTFAVARLARRGARTSA